MRDYLEAKVREFSEKLLYAQSVLADLSLAGNHHNLVAELRTICLEIDAFIRQIRTVLALNLPRLFPRLQVILVQINIRFERFEDFYFPALRQEGPAERAVSSVIGRLLDQLQVTWITDKVVSFSRAVSLYPGVKNCPIFFLPNYTRKILVHWLGLYHEIGHAAYQHFPEIGERLADAVLTYCQQQLLQAPALTTSQLNKRTERLRQVLLYWNTYRLGELFCDIFATIVTGPVYLFSWVDISLTCLSGPYDTDLADVHPPNAARTQACMLALHDCYAAAPLKRATTDLWDGFAARRIKPPLFHQMCPFALILAIVRSAQAEVTRHGFPVYTTAHLSPPQSLSYESTENFQDLLNVAMVNLMFAPSQFPAWQTRIAEKLSLAAATTGGS